MNWQTVNFFGLILQIGAGILLIRFGYNTERIADKDKNYKKLRKFAAKLQIGLGWLWIIGSIVYIVRQL